MSTRHITHALVLHYILIVYENFRIAWIAIATIVMYVKFFMVVSIVRLWTAPSWKWSALCFWPWIMRIIQCQWWNSSAIQVEWIKCITIQLQLRMFGDSKS